MAHMEGWGVNKESIVQQLVHINGTTKLRKDARDTVARLARTSPPQLRINSRRIISPVEQPK